jgi:NAD(P)-dependent dehydrogenase (short-subunit alcohol dehydrogenase family)
MIKRGWGRVVFISSESALAIPKDMIDYGMTKTAQLAISRGLAEAVGGTGVTVNAVVPRPTNSEIQSNWSKAMAQSQGITQEEAEQQFLKTMRPTMLINRFTTTDEVAVIARRWPIESDRKGARGPISPCHWRSCES